MITHDAVVLDALQEARAVLQSMRHQVEQMRGMFDDADGTVQAACDDQEAAAKKITRAIGTLGRSSRGARREENRLFIGVFPCGIVYCDRAVEVNNDYKRLGFLSYSTLELELKPGCPPDLRERIEEDARQMQNRRGQQFPISSTGQYVILGQ